MLTKINNFVFGIVICLLPSICIAGNYSYFHHVPEALSEITIHESVQTPDGVIWFATELGLFRYDGHSTKKILLKGDGPSSNYLRAIEVNPDGKLWLGYFGSGIALYNPETGNFERKYHVETRKKDEEKNNFNRIWSLLLTKDNKLWIGTFTNGLFHYTPETKSISRIPTNIGDTPPPTNRIYTLEAVNGNLYAGTNYGLLKLDNSTNSFQRLMLSDPEIDFDGSQPSIWGLDKGKDNNIWIASDKGLYVYNPDDSTGPNSFQKVNENLPDRILRDVLYDKEKNRLWIATANSGLALHEIDSGNLNVYEHNPNRDSSLSSNGVFSIYKDMTGLLWINTTKGTNLLDIRTLLFSYWPTNNHYTNIETSAVLTLNSREILAGIGVNIDLISTSDHKNIKSFKVSGGTLDNPINTLFQDSKGRIWAGLAYGGLHSVDLASKKTTLLESFQGQRSTIHEIVESDDGTLWIASSGTGLLSFNPKNKKLTKYDIGNSRNITALEIFHDSLWVGAMDGLYRIHFQNGHSRKLLPESSKKIPLPGLDDQSWIMDIKKHSNGILIGSTSSLYFIEESNAPRLVFGGPKNPTAVLSILSENNKKYWFSTASGIYEYNADNNTFSQHTETEGLPFDVFLPQSADMQESALYFGGTHGLLRFPKKTNLSRTNHLPVSILSATTYSGTETKESIISNENGFTLNPNEKVLQLEFAVMDYLYPDKHKYKYRLIGISDNWVTTENNQATFANLPPGKYEFQLLGSNADGYWSNKPEILEITVQPPWWRATWAYVTYFLIAFFLLTAFVWHQNRRIARIRETNRQLREAEELREHFIDQLEEQVSSATSDLRDSMEALQIKAVELEVANKRAQDASQLKSQFLAHISHELRTPLNGILGFADLLDRTKLDTSQKEYLQTITKSGEGLLLTVNNLLDISKIEAGKVSLETGDFSLQECVSETLVMLAPIALEKHLELCSIIDPELPLYLRGDAARLRQILTNLVGNAIKFTNSGSVTVRLLLDELQDDRARFTLAVSDTGIGITPEQREKLFTSFTQADPGIQRRFGGTGLGLSLCKMLVEAMDGNIDLQSTAGIGTTVSIRLSLPLANPDEENWQPDSRLANATILLYDSHPLSAQGFTSLFQGWKASVVETDSLSAFEAELQRHRRQARYAACVVCLDEAQISALREDDGELLRLLTGRRDLPLMVLASTLDMDRLCSLEVRFEAACLAKHAGFRTIHQALVGILNEQPQFSRTLRKLETETDSDLAGTRILIADDNAANRELLQHMLRHAGVHTAEAADGREALTRLRDEQWDLLLLDIHMPGVSGLEVVSRIRDGRAGNSMLPVIAITANALPEMQQWARACGMDGYIIKPFTEEQLMSEIERLRKRDV